MVSKSNVINIPHKAIYALSKSFLGKHSDYIRDIIKFSQIKSINYDVLFSILIQSMLAENDLLGVKSLVPNLRKAFPNTALPRTELVSYNVLKDSTTLDACLSFATETNDSNMIATILEYQIANNNGDGDVNKFKDIVNDNRVKWKDMVQYYYKNVYLNKNPIGFKRIERIDLFEHFDGVSVYVDRPDDGDEAALVQEILQR